MIEKKRVLTVVKRRKLYLSHFSFDLVSNDLVVQYPDLNWPSFFLDKLEKKPLWFFPDGTQFSPLYLGTHWTASQLLGFTILAEKPLVPILQLIKGDQKTVFPMSNVCKVIGWDETFFYFH
jgi:hypothetical protein